MSVHFARPVLRRQWQKRLDILVLQSSSRKQFMGAKLFWSQCWINLIVASHTKHGAVVLCRVVFCRRAHSEKPEYCIPVSAEMKVLRNSFATNQISIWKKDHLFWGKSMSPFHEKTSNITLIQEFFDGFDWNKRDKRMDGFPLMSSIWPTIFISLAYANLAKIVGPFFMRNKSPLKLDKFARCYNTSQFLCELLLIPWLSVYFFSTGISWSK